MERLFYKTMVNIIPMSGSGSRFSSEGYLLPKPLISVSGKTMIERVVERLPKADKWIFVVRKEHVAMYQIDSFIKKIVPDAVVVVEENPWGQAPSCMLAMPHVEENDEIFIAACDNSFLYDVQKFESLCERPDVDAITWTFTQDTLLTDNPQAWGWVKVASDGEEIIDMSVKIPVSDSPFNDHAVVASFYFKRASDFKAAYNLMVKEDYRINNEYYVDSMPIFMKKFGKKSVIFDIDLYVGWGKPKDLHLYEQYDFFNTQGRLENEKWKKFFKGVA